MKTFLCALIIAFVVGLLDGCSKTYEVVNMTPEQIQAVQKFCADQGLFSNTHITQNTNKTSVNCYAAEVEGAKPVKPAPKPLDLSRYQGEPLTLKLDEVVTRSEQ